MDMAPERILIADEERRTAEVLQRLLSREGYVVEVATRLEEVRTPLLRDLYDVVLIGLRLADTSGIEALRLCREVDPALAILMLAPFGTVESAAQACGLSPEDFLAKPIR